MQEITIETAAREIIQHCMQAEPELVNAVTERLIKFLQEEEINMAVGVTALYRAANIGVKFIISESDKKQIFKPRIVTQ